MFLLLMEETLKSANFDIKGMLLDESGIAIRLSILAELDGYFFPPWMSLRVVVQANFDF